MTKKEPELSEVLVFTDPEDQSQYEVNVKDLDEFIIEPSSSKVEATAASSTTTTPGQNERPARWAVVFHPNPGYGRSYGYYRAFQLERALGYELDLPKIKERKNLSDEAYRNKVKLTRELILYLVPPDVKDKILAKRMHRTKVLNDMDKQLFTEEDQMCELARKPNVLRCAREECNEILLKQPDQVWSEKVWLSIRGNNQTILADVDSNATVNVVKKLILAGLKYTTPRHMFHEGTNLMLWNMDNHQYMHTHTPISDYDINPSTCTVAKPGNLGYALADLDNGWVDPLDIQPYTGSFKMSEDLIQYREEHTEAVIKRLDPARWKRIEQAKLSNKKPDKNSKQLPEESKISTSRKNELNYSFDVELRDEYDIQEFDMSNG